MSKIVSMSSGAIDPIAVTKRVFWRPATAGTLLLIGDPVCYRLDAEDHKKRTVDPVHLGLTRDTYAEGEQEMTSRLFCVEEPLVDNIGAFAGIVKSLGSLDGADGDMIEIFKANSGAVVPANVILASTTAGRSILAVMANTRTLGSPTQDISDYMNASDDDTPGTIDSKVVGIAMETLTAAGKCWVKLDENMFQYQGGQVDQEYVVEAVAVDVTINKMNIEFNVTAGHCQMLHYRARLAGIGGDADRGVYRFETVMEAPQASGQHMFGVNCHLELASDWNAAPGGHASPLKISIRSDEVDPDLSGLTILAAIHIDWILRETTTGTLTNPPTQNGMCIIYINSDSAGTQADSLLRCERMSDIGGYLAEGTMVGADANDIMIPVVIGNIKYYLVARADDDIA